MAPKRKMNIFDILRYLTHGKKPWEKLTDEERKLSPYMLNKWLSMDSDLLPAVNELQRYTVTGMPTEFVYKLYYDLLPDVKFYFRYVKGKSQSKYNVDVKNLIAKHLKISSSEAEDCLDLIMQCENSKEILDEFLRMYGKNDKEIKALLK